MDSSIRYDVSLGMRLLRAVPIVMVYFAIAFCIFIFLPDRAREIPLKSIGQKSDIANMATFLASDLSNYVTGAILNVDGGNELGNADYDFSKPFDRKP